MSTINNNSRKIFDEPSLVLNDPGKGKKVLTELIRQLKKCEAFRFYVAFVTQSGIQSLKQQLAELRDGNIKGKILVSTYLNFTCPTALKALKEFDNLEVRIANSGNFHAKGYYFNSSSEWRFIIGSSNWTGNALSSNTELNILVHTDNSHTLTKELIKEFDIQFKKSEPLTDDFIDEYKLQHKEAKTSLGSSTSKPSKTEKLQPNKMQLDAMGGAHKT